MTEADRPVTIEDKGLAIDDHVDHLRGPQSGRMIIEYGDYECPYSRLAYRAIQRIDEQLEGTLRFAFRHFPLSAIHPHALGAAAAAEAAGLQGRFWEMHDLLFHRQKALADADLRRYALEVGLDLDRFERDRTSLAVRERVEHDVRGGGASGVRGTPTLFIDGIRHRGPYDAQALRAKLSA